MATETVVEVWLCHTPGGRRLSKSWYDLARKTGESVCLYQPGRQVESPYPRSIPIFPPLHPLSPLISHHSSCRELRQWREHPIGVSLSNEGGHHAPLLAPGESILGIHSPPHSSILCGVEIPSTPLAPRALTLSLSYILLVQHSLRAADAIHPSHEVPLQCISPPALLPFAPDISK